MIRIFGKRGKHGDTPSVSEYLVVCTRDMHYRIKDKPNRSYRPILSYAEPASGAGGATRAIPGVLQAHIP